MRSPHSVRASCAALATLAALASTPSARAEPASTAVEGAEADPRQEPVPDAPSIGAGSSVDGATLRAAIDEARAAVPGLTEEALFGTMGLQVVVGNPGPNGTLDWVREPGTEPAAWFYPASAMKPMVAAAALARAEEDGVGWDATLRIEALSVDWEGVDVVVSEGVRRTTLADRVWAAVQRSDNPAHNHLLDVAGLDEANERLHAWGYASVRLRTRLQTEARIPAVQRAAPAVLRRSPDGRWEPWRPERAPGARPDDAPVDGPPWLGAAHISDAGERVEGPMSFAPHNAVSLLDLVRFIVNVTEPALDGPEGDLPLSEGARALLEASMTEPPAGAGRGGSTADRRARLRPLEAGFRSARRDPETLRVASKAGFAYGFLVDVARVEDTRTGRRLFVGVALYANANETLNDDRYETHTLARPFVVALGRALAERVLTR